VNLESDTFKIALCVSGSNVSDTTVDSFLSVTGEHTPTSGYLTGGETLTGVSCTESLGVVTFTADDPSFIANGGSIVCKYAVLYVDSVTTPVSKPIVGHLDLGPLGVTITSGNMMTLNFPTTGIFTIS